ncbi:MAG: cytochrome P450 [Ginsengibacter sp.]
MQKTATTYLPEISRRRAFADAPRMIKNPIEIFDEYTALAGDTYIFHFGGVKKAIVSSNPKFIQHVLKTNYENYHKSDIQLKRMGQFLGNGLLTSHGKYWLTQRRLIQQAFHKDQLAALIFIMQEVLDKSIAGLEDEMNAGAIDIYTEMMKITFRMATRSLFSTSLSEEELDTISNGISTIQKFMVKQIVQPFLNPWFRASGILRKYNNMRFRSDKIIFDYIIKRRADKDRKYNDLLQILFDARYEDGEGMNDLQVLSESMQLLVAGHETSSNAISWTLYLLCKHPESIKKIREEISTELGNAPMQFTDIPKLQYTTQVIEESLRLYPPFWLIDREASEPDNIMGINIPKGTMVISYIYGLHHSANYWDNPEEFIPERFSKENKKLHQPFTHLPFGGGPRGCIGGNYAMMQILVILVTLLRKFNFDLMPDKKIGKLPMIILRPKDGIKMRFTKLT